MLGEVNAAFSLLERIRKWRDSKKNAAVESVAARFIRLFESHGVHRNQIPRFLAHGLHLQDVQDDNALLAKLDEAILAAACSLFAVRREWLDGAEAQIYPFHDFYKSPQEVAGFIQNLKISNPEGQLDGVLIAPDEPEGEALLILQEMIGSVGDKPIYRFHHCNNWLFPYWKARAYLTACVAIAWKHAVHIRGVTMPKKEIQRMTQGESLLGLRSEGTLAFAGKQWYPEDMALEPAVFLQGIDSERNNFGIASGLELWLRLEEQGYMDTGLEMYKDGIVRRGFEQELAKYAPATDSAPG